MPTLDDILKKLENIETKIINIERRVMLGDLASFLPVLEENAKKCENFQGYTYTITGNTIDIEPTFQIKCSCNKPEHMMFLCGETVNINKAFLQTYIDEINQKYKKLPIPRPQIKNITERMEV